MDPTCQNFYFYFYLEFLNWADLMCWVIYFHIFRSIPYVQERTRGYIPCQRLHYTCEPCLSPMGLFTYSWAFLKVPPYIMYPIMLQNTQARDLKALAAPAMS